ncbi:META domain-containing protein [Methylonatrum kenyense]|uniref:META domain-containing protein n=1 Tax=Methylonatrum kenyense TaxID=455253 RepID=UPI0020BF59ED|nr:META domain-containing protein [Methylonatrum kenyense]MCK8515650.1 META domain-containing protein [Methylonatrum kenyense]
MHHRLIIVALAVSLLAACASQPEFDKQASETRSYLCGDREVSVAIFDDHVRILSDEETRLLPEPAAFGSRYQAMGEPPAATYWSRGDRALVQKAGEQLPECRRLHPLPETLKASGNEPFWNLILEQDALAFRTFDQEQMLESDTVIRQGETVHAASGDARLRAHFERTICKDNMTGMPYPYRVKVLFADRDYAGCGGDPLDLLRGRWRITAVDGRTVDGDARADIRFDDEGRVSGRAACNSFHGPFEITGESLRIGSLATTMMACEPELMRLESRILRELEQVTRFGIDDGGRLRLYSAGGRLIEARR